MKVKKCPYCSRRISYASSFASRRKGEYVCRRCGKESKVIIKKSVVPVFILTVLISLAIMAVWIFAGLLNNPLGAVFVAVPFIVFAIISPGFVTFGPLKKYKKSMEAKKEGIAYSDNIITSELDESSNYSFPSLSPDTDSSFAINTDVFNKIKAERNAAREKLSENNNNLVSDSGKIQDDSDYIPVIDNVSENHNIDDVPLKKLHSDSVHTAVRRNHHYISRSADEEVPPAPKRNDTNRYSSNRKF